ncbi:MAG: site-specific integrase [Calditrichaeota bacterium]|nr:site-specific integrase [Calditrichota bacterium]
MDELVDKMQQDMVIRNYSPRTVESYLWHVKAFQAHIQKPLEQTTEDDIRSYLYHVKTVKQYSRSNPSGIQCDQISLSAHIENAAQVKRTERPETRSAVAAGVSHR